MGGPYKDVITDEERAILEEDDKVDDEVKEVTPEGTGTLKADPPAQETEKPAETAAATETKIEPEALTEEEKIQAESTGFKVETDEKGRTYLVDDEGSKIPEKRFREIYRKSKEGEAAKEKYDLFKQLGQDEFYKLYPEEKPEGYKPPEPKRPDPAPQGFNVLDLQVKGGTYEGYTLREVMQTDPDEGTRMLNEWKDSQHTEIRKQEETANEAKRKQETDAFNFGMARAKEIFGIEDASKLTPEHNRKLYLLGQEVLDWQIKTNRLGLSWEDAYTIMKHNDLIKTAKTDAVANAVKGLQKSGPASINTGGGGDIKPSGFEAVARMTDKELERHIDSLDDASYKKFFKEAPASIRAKHPGMPWE